MEVDRPASFAVTHAQENTINASVSVSVIDDCTVQTMTFK